MMIDGRSPPLVEPVGVSDVLAAAPAALEAAVSAPILGASTVGTPVDLPPTWMFAALRTASAATLRLRETRIPASPASTKPFIAIRSALPSGTPGNARSTARPLPDDGPNGVM